MYRRRFGKLDVLPLKWLAFAIATTLTSSASAQDELLKDLFQGVEFSRHIPNAGTDLYARTYSRFESRGREYVALTYYQPYPNFPRQHYVSYALLERVGEEYKLRLDHVAADDGAQMEYEKPFLYTVDTEDLVVFSLCYRGCNYSFFRLDATASKVTLQGYDGLSAGETFSGRGDVFRFDESGLSATFNVALEGDAACCPSGGKLQVFYELRGNQFQIARAERSGGEL